MVRADSGERRRFQRFGVNGVKARLLLPGKGAIQVAVSDLSEGGAPVRCDQPIAQGTTVSFELADVGAAAAATVIRSNGDVIGIEFHDAAARSLVSHVMGEQPWREPSAHGMPGGRAPRVSKAA